MSTTPPGKMPRMTNPPPDPDQQTPESAQDTAHAGGGQADAASRDLRTLGVFNPRRLTRQLGRDSAMRWAVVAAVVLMLPGLVMFDAGGSVAGLVLAVLVIGSWIGMSVVSAKVTRDLPQLTAMVDGDPDAAEDALVGLLHRKPLLRWVRLLLYHRLAAVRHHQRRYAEAAAICRSVLACPLGPAEAARAHLLLLLTESSLAIGDLPGAYHALLGLHQTRLSLTEALQRLALQTRYESLIGADDAALWALEHKLALCELMPAPQCGSLHALLARSADRLGGGDRAKWLWARAQLLCTKPLLDAMRDGAPGVGIVGGTPDHMNLG